MDRRSAGCTVVPVLRGQLASGGRGLGYWDSFAAPSAFEHLWSLAIEEQFYLVWPVLVLLLWRFGRDRAMLFGTIVGFVASALAMVIVFDGGDPTRVYMGKIGRAHV